MRCHHCVDQCALRARSTHGVHHAIVEVNIVIGVVLGELHVVRVVPLVVVCDDAVVRRTLILIAVVAIIVFVVTIFHRIVLYWRYTVCSSSTYPTTQSPDHPRPLAVHYPQKCHP